MKSVIVVMVVLGTLAFSTSASPCVCIDLIPADRLASTDVVFVGEFVESAAGTQTFEIRRGTGKKLFEVNGIIEATFRVTRAVKGDVEVGGLVVIKSADFSCGDFFGWREQNPGTRWVIYALEMTGVERPFEILKYLPPPEEEGGLVTDFCLSSSQEKDITEHEEFFDSQSL